MIKIRYPRTTFEICDVTLSIIRKGMRVSLDREYPEMACYNGRRWNDGLKQRKRSLYYTKTNCRGYIGSGPLLEFDIRTAILRTSDESINCGFPFFWCTAWYRIGELGRRVSDPATYTEQIHADHFHVPYWGGLGGDARKIDLAEHIPELEIFHSATPPCPIEF